MKRVRQVSIVLRAVAEMERVTLRPKKLKPLFRQKGWISDLSEWRLAQG